MTTHYLDLLAETIRQNWNKPALTDFYFTNDGTAQDTARGNHYTYGEMHSCMLQLSERFRSLGLQKGDHIAICGKNAANWAVAYLAIAAYQGVVVTVLNAQNTDDIAHQLNFSDAVCLFTDPDLYNELRHLNLPQIRHVLSLADFSILSQSSSASANQTIPSKAANSAEQAEINTVSLPHGTPNDLAQICFTSGSTGQSKGVMLSAGSISNNVECTIAGYPNEETPQFLSVLPMAHMYGLITEILAQLCKGKHVYILHKITVDNVYYAIILTRPYALRLIPFWVSSLMRTHQDCLQILSDCCKQIYIGGSLFDATLERQLYDAKIPFSIGYGMSESGPLISYSPCFDYKLHTCGKIVNNMQAAFSDEGEILVRGENVMLGYYKDPEATARKIDNDGWLHTGDAGYLDNDGYLYVTGRIGQDIIVLPNGENIHPEDIESKINTLPNITESLVLARNGHLVALVRPNSPNNIPLTQEQGRLLRRTILTTINPQLPLHAQLYDLEIINTPLEKTAKGTIKRYLYK